MSSVLVFKSALYPTTERKFNKAQVATKNGTKYKSKKKKSLQNLTKNRKRLFKKQSTNLKKVVEKGWRWALFFKST